MSDQLRSNQLFLVAAAIISAVVLFTSADLFRLPQLFAEGSSGPVVADLSSNALDAISQASQRLAATATPGPSAEEAYALIQQRVNAQAAEAGYVPVAYPTVQVAEVKPAPEVYVAPPTPQVIVVPAPVVPQAVTGPSVPTQPVGHDGQFWHQTPIGEMSCGEIYLEWGGNSAMTQVGSRFANWFNGLPAPTRVAYFHLCDYAKGGSR